MRIFFASVLFCCFILCQEGLTQFTCPMTTGYFADIANCDAYISCNNFVAERKFCPEGLFFDDRSLQYPRYPCTYPSDVQCGSRTRTRVKRLPRIGRRR